MNIVINQMLHKYSRRSVEEEQGALREILQEIALLGLWRGKFFEKAAFYGGTALRILYGLDRFSEDLDFSLLKKDARFRLDDYGAALEREMKSFGFDVTFQKKESVKQKAIESAFLKGNTLQQMLTIKTADHLQKQQHGRELLKIKLEIDTQPPGKFKTESRYLLQPIPFAVRVFSLPDLFAGKMHALFARSWKSGRVKGRDWYDFLWYVTYHPELHLAHLEERLRASNHDRFSKKLSEKEFQELLAEAIDSLNLLQAKRDVEPFLRHPHVLDAWSKELFRDVARRIKII